MRKMLLLLIFLNSICFISSAVLQAENKSEFTVDARIALSSMTALADGHIKKMVDALEMSSMTEAVKSGDWQRMKPLLAKVQHLNIPNVVWFVRPDGSYFTVDKDLVDKNLKDRDYFPKVMSGETVIGSLVVSRSTGRKALVVAVPIRNANDIVGALGASIFVEEFSEIIKKEMRLPDNIIFYAVDSQAQAVLHYRASLIFSDGTAQGSDSLTQAVKHMLSNSEGTVEYEYEGRLRKLIFQTSPLTGWRFAMGSVLEN